MSSPFLARAPEGALRHTAHVQPGSPALSAEPACSVLVVIVNYRTPALTVASLRALAPEIATQPGARVVVVDNDSGDDSVSVIEQAILSSRFESWASCVLAPHNGGYAYGNNLAIRMALFGSRAEPSASTTDLRSRARGRASTRAVPPRYVWLLNPDTQVRRGSLRALVDFLDANPRVGIAGSCLEDPDGSRWSTAFRFPNVLGELEGGARLGPLSRLLARFKVPVRMAISAQPVDWLPGASMMIRREVFESIGLLDEHYFLYYEETDFCLRARRAGFPCWYVPSSRVMHIAGQSTGVTDWTARPRRTPRYMFDSKHRYFVKNHGWTYALAADLAWLVGFASWRMRRALSGRPDADPPHLLADALRHGSLARLRRLVSG